MIDPAFSHIRIWPTAFWPPMVGAVDAHERCWTRAAASGEPFSLDLAMSHLTADVICRTIFSDPLDSSVAREVFDDFLLFERSVASVDLWQLIVGRPWAKIPSRPRWSPRARASGAASASCSTRDSRQRAPGRAGCRRGRFTSADDIVGAIIDVRRTRTPGSPSTARS